MNRSTVPIMFLIKLNNMNVKSLIMLKTESGKFSTLAAMLRVSSSIIELLDGYIYC